ncbi:MAG: DUF6164 family protein [Gammaproteobacteria bacterium]|nr:DUF6164 family protein [Gammaproteobacteria bacterium]
MPVQLFKLRNVPADEAQEVRELLINNNIDFYETPPGNWGISMPAIWLNEDDQLDRAKILIDEYQKDRQVRIKQEYEQSKIERKQQNFINELLTNPLQFLLYVGIAAVILYFSIKPFLNFGK